jgi:hypothetical protein
LFAISPEPNVGVLEKGIAQSESELISALLPIRFSVEKTKGLGKETRGQLVTRAICHKRIEE